MDTLNTCTHSKKDTHPAHPWVSEQRVLALANRSVHSSSCSCSFISLSGSEPERRSGGVIPFHPSFCMFNPLLSISRSLLATPPSPSHCSCLPPPSLQTSAFLPLHSIDQSLSIPSPHPSFPSPPPIKSIHLSLFFFFFSFFPLSRRQTLHRLASVSSSLSQQTECLHRD